MNRHSARAFEPKDHDHALAPATLTLTLNKNLGVPRRLPGWDRITPWSAQGGVSYTSWTSFGTPRKARKRVVP
jgi:hypothetical protein